eukprot:COSAG02_NODE_12618_length_1518_cov_1.479211_1_plen_312_part_01
MGSGSLPSEPSGPLPELDAKQSSQGGASALQMAQVVPGGFANQTTLPQPQHHHVSTEYEAEPGCIGPEEGKLPFMLFIPGLILMIIGTALISTGAVYPLTITGGSLILGSWGWHSIYRLCLDGDICPGRTGMGGFWARLGGNLLCAFCYMEWFFLAVVTPEPYTAFFTGMTTIVFWPVAFCLMRREAEQCRQAVMTAWRNRQPININQASVAQLTAAARAKGEPYFPASVVHLLGEKRVDGEVLKAVLEAERTAGPDCDHARAFFDELFLGVGIHHTIAAKGILRDWVERGVPQELQLAETTLVVTAVSTL